MALVGLFTVIAYYMRHRERKALLIYQAGRILVKLFKQQQHGREATGELNSNSNCLLGQRIESAEQVEKRVSLVQITKAREQRRGSFLSEELAFRAVRRESAQEFWENPLMRSMLAWECVRCWRGKCRALKGGPSVEPEWSSFARWAESELFLERFLEELE